MTLEPEGGRETPAALTFLGAAGALTGSQLLIDTGAEGLLVDCGLLRGEREWRRRN